MSRKEDEFYEGIYVVNSQNIPPSEEMQSSGDPSATIGYGEIFDRYHWTEHRKILTIDELKVPALRQIAYANLREASAPIPIHYHSDVLELRCMFRGSFYTNVLENGFYHQRIANGGQIYLVYPFELHGTSEPQPPNEGINLQIELNDPNHMLGLSPEFSRSLYYELTHLKGRVIQLGSTHISLLRSAFNFMQDMRTGSIMIGTQFLSCFLFSLPYLQSVKSNQETQVSPQIQNVLQYIRDNIGSPVQIQELADVAEYSLSHFKTKFKEEIGITPAAYISLQKMESARELLQNTDLSITEIAFKLGFSSSNYFSSVFHKIMGCPPKTYRKQLL